MDIQHKAGPNGGKFLVEQDGKRVAALVYDRDNGRLLIEHTEVDKSLRGQNIGYELVRSAVDFARREGLTILPVCPFAKAQIQKHPEWTDVVR